MPPLRLQAIPVRSFLRSFSSSPTFLAAPGGGDHVTNKPSNNAQSDASNAGQDAKKQEMGQGKSTQSTATGRGDAGAQKTKDKDFPEAPKGMAMGMQDERGGKGA